MLLMLLVDVMHVHLSDGLRRVNSDTVSMSRERLRVVVELKRCYGYIRNE